MGIFGGGKRLTTQLHIPVTSSLFSATLAATGVAAWLDQLCRDVLDRTSEIRIANAGYALVVSTDATIEPSMVRPEHFALPFRWIRTAKNGAAPTNAPEIDYEAERRHNADYYDRLKIYRQQGINLRSLPIEIQNELAQQAPRPYWPVAALINQMGALGSYNKAAERWLSCRAVYPELVNVIWTLFSGMPTATEEGKSEWEILARKHGLEKAATMPATQVVNPEQGKGANRAKADALTIGGQDSFWLLEYFKYAGLYQAAAPRTVQGRKDRKTYVVLPARDGIGQRWHRDIFADFQQNFWASSAIKMDILATLRYTASMLAQWEGAQRATGRKRRASDFVDGFVVASFKDLGSAVAVMNVATLRLPEWIGWPKDAEEATELQNVTREHQLLVAVLDEKKGEEEQLLRAYRDFSSSRDPELRAFFDFTGQYASHLLRKMSKQQPARRLATNNIDRILTTNDERRQETGMSPFKPIVENEGFRSIATAIRQSTVTQQYHKVRSNDNLYEVRYGLADELRRKSREGDEFIRAIMEFVQQYAQENARINERNKGQGYRRRPLVSTQDLDRLVELVDAHGAPTVAALLIAYGYAYDPRTPEGTPNAAGGDIPPAIDEDTQDETDTVA